MKINIRINPELTEPFVEVHTRELTAEIQEMIERINHTGKSVLTAIKDQKIYIVNPAEVACFFTENQRVLARTAGETFVLKHKLYELEQMVCETCDHRRLDTGWAHPRTDFHRDLLDHLSCILAGHLAKNQE